MENDQRNMIILAVLAWWLWNRPEVSASISFPQIPEGVDTVEPCYDPETDSYYVGDC